MYVYVCVYKIFFVYSSIDGHLGFDHVLAIVNNAAMNMGVQTFLWDSVLFHADNYPGVELLNHTPVLLLIFWGPSVLFSIAVPQVYIPTKVWGFLFLHVLVDSCYFLSFWSNI